MKKDIGAVLFISGTTIGAGMLALPVVTSPLGLLLTLGFYAFVFLVMLLSAKLFLKTVLSFEGTHNFVELSKKTLGSKAAGFCWLIYLLLMYALVAAYISASSHMMTELISKALPTLSESVFFLLMPLVFAFFVHYGFKGIDFLNRLFMVGLAVSFLALCFQLLKTANLHLQFTANFNAIGLALPILITSFGYHIVIPSVANYLNRDKKRIHRAILIGSIIPLFVYLTWQLLIYCNLSYEDLESCLKQDIPITDVLSKLHPSLSLISYLFAFFAIITSFLGVSLSLFDFLKDSLPSKKIFQNGKMLFILTFLPPLIYIFYFKKAFYLALDHAGILVSILLVILPSFMYLKIFKKHQKTPVILIIIGLSVIILDILQKAHLLNA